MRWGCQRKGTNDSRSAKCRKQTFFLNWHFVAVKTALAFLLLYWIELSKITFLNSKLLFLRVDPVELSYILVPILVAILQNAIWPASRCLLWKPFKSRSCQMLDSNRPPRRYSSNSDDGLNHWVWVLSKIWQLIVYILYTDLVADINCCFW